MPESMLLEAWGRQLYRAFGEMPFMVGSATEGKAWRDIDVRMMLSPKKWKRLFGKTHKPDRYNALWAALCTAISLWGRQVTGLPIDFQFQQRDEANDRYGGRIREPIGLGLYTPDGKHLRA